MLPPGKKPPNPPSPPSPVGKSPSQPFPVIPRPGGLIDPFAKTKLAPDPPKTRSAAARAALKLPFASGVRARIGLHPLVANGQVPISQEVTGLRLGKPTTLLQLLPREADPEPTSEPKAPEPARPPEKGPGLPGPGLKPGARPLFAATGAKTPNAPVLPLNTSRSAAPPSSAPPSAPRSLGQPVSGPVKPLSGKPAESPSKPATPLAVKPLAGKPADAPSKPAPSGVTKSSSKEIDGNSKTQEIDLDQVRAALRPKTGDPAKPGTAGTTAPGRTAQPEAAASGRPGPSRPAPPSTSGTAPGAQRPPAAGATEQRKPNSAPVQKSSELRPPAAGGMKMPGPNKGKGP